jgi:alpha-beta hydrolase superfamily lysophospholipase
MSTIRARDQRELAVHAWTAPKPKVAVALVHGWGEHASRYAHVGKAFAAREISLYAVDLRGHGDSKGPRGHIERFEEYLDDAAALIAHVEADAPGVPRVLMGHSMGGLTMIDFLLAHGATKAAGLVLTSPYLALALPTPAIKRLAGKLMSGLMPTFAQATNMFGRHVCADPALQAEYDRDPQNVKAITARTFTESLAAQERARAGAGKLTLPLLLLYGGADQVASADVTDAFAGGLTMTDKTVERLAGLYHEILNEPPATREPLIARIGDWVLAHAV